MRRRTLAVVSNAALVVCLAGLLVTAAQGQTTDRQVFTVIVPGNLSIVAPGDVVATYTSGDIAFAPTTPWQVKANVRNGATVTFETATPFVNRDDLSVMRDARLDLMLFANTGPATWTINAPTDSTNWASSKPGAVVAASSNRVGRAQFNLTVTFFEGDPDSLLVGEYVTTVVGTVVANN